MKRSWLALLCALWLAPPAHACGMTSKLVPFEVVGGSVAVDASSPDLPAPVAVVTEVVRGIGSNHATCDDTGLLTIVVEWPRGKFKPRDLGFEFVVVSGKTPYPIFPATPVQAPLEGRRGDFLFMWTDGPPAQQAYIDLQVEVRAVTRDNQRGAPARILVRAAPGG
jgi:hypothetical protein